MSEYQEKIKTALASFSGKKGLKIDYQDETNEVSIRLQKVYHDINPRTLFRIFLPDSVDEINIPTIEVHDRNFAKS